MAWRRPFFTKSFQAEYDSWEDPGLDRVAQIAVGVRRGDGAATDQGARPPK